MSIGKRPRERIQQAVRADLESELAGLVERARQGDLDAFRALHARYYDRLYSYAYFRLGGSEDARDVVQEVFLGAWRRLGSFEYRHDGSFPAWLFRIARNIVADRIRTAKRRPELRLDDIPETPVEFEGEALSRRLIVDMLGRLPDKQREVVVLRFLVGMSLAEVANAIGKSEGAVEQLQLRGIERLRKEMASE